MQRSTRQLDSTAMGPEETMRIVSYFDVLLTRGAGIDGLLRGAAVLSGAAAGARIRGRSHRRDPDGHLLDAGEEAVHSSERSGTGWRVWLERQGAPRANDDIILDRLAFGVGLLEARRRPENGLETLIDAGCSSDERAAAAARLRIDSRADIRIVATPAEAPELGGASALVPTKYGMVRATLDRDGELARAERMGIGSWVGPVQAPESWEAAVIGLRLSNEKVPVVDGSELGAMLIRANSYDPRSPHPDVLALAELDARSAEILLALVEAESLRSAAAVLGMHHSTVQLRHQALTETLGYDPRSNLGRMRYIAANLLLRLAEP